MADLNIHDGRDVLQHLKDCGWTGQPMTNMGMVYAYYGVNADDFLNTFRSLEQDGYIEIAGKRTLDDLAAHIDERMNAPETNTAKLRDYSWAEKTFRNDDGPVSFFSNCSPRLTLRGRYALATGKDITIKSMPPVDLDAARQAFAAKKAAEELEAEKGKPMKAFRDVLGAVLNDKARKDFKWEYAVEYWGEESWNAFHRHENLVETNTTYREAFNNASKAFAKNILCSDKHEDKTLDGSFLSHIIGNPFTRTLLLESFLMAAHPVNSYKLLTNLHKVETIYKDLLTGSSAPKTN